MKPRRALMPKTHLINAAGSILFPGNARFIPTPTTSLYAPIPAIVRTRNAKYNLLEDRFFENRNIVVRR